MPSILTYWIVWLLRWHICKIFIRFNSSLLLQQSSISCSSTTTPCNSISVCSPQIWLNSSLTWQAPTQGIIYWNGIVVSCRKNRFIVTLREIQQHISWITPSTVLQASNIPVVDSFIIESIGVDLFVTPCVVSLQLDASFELVTEENHKGNDLSEDVQPCEHKAPSYDICFLQIVNNTWVATDWIEDTSIEEANSKNKRDYNVFLALDLSRFIELMLF